jgi:hypothetical protein
MLDAVSGQALLQRHGAAYSVGRLVERGKDAVASSVHDRAAVLVDDLVDEAIMPFQEMAPCLIADRRHERRRIADVGEHERTGGCVAGRPGRWLEGSWHELISKRPHLGRWTDPDLVLEATSEIGISLHRLGQIASPCEGQHQMLVAALAQRLTLDEGAGGSLGRDQLISAEAKPGGCDAFKRSQFDVAQTTPLSVDPRRAGGWQERASGRVQGNTRRRPRRCPLTTRNGGFGSVNRFGGGLNVYE